ncbi:hypothetical protein J6590_043606 [Homalodisca vitripennis]|nr:hypothetical protein J6590_043606 [Homalodisca vitripennis]
MADTGPVTRMSLAWCTGVSNQDLLGREKRNPSIRPEVCASLERIGKMLRGMGRAKQLSSVVQCSGRRPTDNLYPHPRNYPLKYTLSTLSTREHCALHTVSNMSRSRGEFSFEMFFRLNT